MDSQKVAVICFLFVKIFGLFIFCIFEPSSNKKEVFMISKEHSWTPSINNF
jgi:hypothetical protein